MLLILECSLNFFFLQTSEYLWRKVFCVSAGFFFVTNLFYVIFGTAELADWNEPEEEAAKEDENPMLMKERR